MDLRELKAEVYLLKKQMERYERDHHYINMIQYCAIVFMFCVLACDVFL